MRKALIFSLSLTVLSLCIIAGVYINVSADKDEPLTAKETTLYGHRTEAAGTSVIFLAKDYNSYKSDWLLSYSIDKSGGLTTLSEFVKNPEKLSGGTQQGKVDELSLRVFNQNYGAGIRINKEDLEKDFGQADTDSHLWDLAPIQEAFKAAASRTENGKKRTETLDLRDYAEAYPLEFERGSGDCIGLTGGTDMSYFDLPMPTYSVVTFNITKDKYGNISEYGVFSALECELDSFGLIGKDGCFMAVTQLTQDMGNGEMVTTKYPKEKRGLHFIPYTKDAASDGKKALDMKNARLVFPLNEDTEVLQLAQYSENSDLQLFTKEDGKVMVTIIDPKTFHQKQKLLIAKDQPDNPLHGFQVSENCTLLRDFEGKIFILGQEKGQYYIAKTDLGNVLEIHEDKVDAEFINGSLCAGTLDHKRGVLFIPSGYLDHYLLVFDEKGLLYAGSYTYDVDSTLAGADSGRIGLSYPITIRGKETAK